MAPVLLDEVLYVRDGYYTKFSIGMSLPSTVYACQTGRISPTCGVPGCGTGAGVAEAGAVVVGARANGTKGATSSAVASGITADDNEGSAATEGRSPCEAGTLRCDVCDLGLGYGERLTARYYAKEVGCTCRDIKLEGCGKHVRITHPCTVLLSHHMRMGWHWTIWFGGSMENTKSGLMF
jgi:hypothetical protein